MSIHGRILAGLCLAFVGGCRGDELAMLQDSGAGRPDAAASGDPDASGGPSESLERLDWLATRGTPLVTGVVTVPAASLFALPADGFVTRSECLGSQGCTYVWHDLAGTAGTRRERMTGVTSSVVSPDGERALLVAIDELETCDDGQGAFSVVRGALQLLDLAAGTVEFELDLRTNVWSAPGFTPAGDWFFAAPIEGTACLPSATGLRSTAAPFARPPGLDAGAELAQVIDARRWLVFRNSNIGLVDPVTAGSFTNLGESPSGFEVTRGWAHVYLGFGALAQDVVSLPPTGPTRSTTLRDEDWYAFGAHARWIRVCRTFQLDETRDCRVVDAQAEAAPVDVRVTIAPDHPDDVVLLDDGAVVFVGPTDDAARAVQRIDLASGRRDVLHVGDGTLRPLGDGDAALLLSDGAAWLIEAGREERLADHVSHVVTAPRLPPWLRRSGERQDDVALLVLSSDDTRFTLAILDVRTRRVATVTDRLYFTPPAGSSFALDDGCGQPWTTRHAGDVLDGLSQEPRYLYFVEQGEPAALWLLPIDLSAPPRRLAELPAGPASCHAPLTSPAGSRVGFAEDVDGATTRVTLSSWE